MTRRSVLRAGVAGIAGAAVGAAGTFAALRATAETEDDPAPSASHSPTPTPTPTSPVLQPDVLIAGGGVGGVAAALALLRAHRSVVLSEPTLWVGGQLTSQGVPPDEPSWIDQAGLGGTRTYLELREAVRNHVRRNYPLTAGAAGQPKLDPGKAWTAPLCAEPSIWHAEIRAALAPYQATNRLRLFTQTTPVSAAVAGGVVQAVRLRTPDGDIRVQPRFVIDATELGDLLPLTGAPYVVGREKGGPRERGGTGEPSNIWTYADPSCQQSFTVVAALGYAPSRPWERVTTPAYADFAPIYERFGANGMDVYDPSQDWLWEEGRNFWEYRRVRYHGYLRDAFLGDISLLNQAENDHAEQPLVPANGRHDTATFKAATARATEQTRGLIEFFQRHYPHPRGSGRGWPGIFPVPNAIGTPNGFAAHPYVRESRRAKTELTITEDHVGLAARTAQHPGAKTAEIYPDSVGTGAGPIDLHHTRAHPHGLFTGTQPFEIPLRSLIPRGMRNLLAGAKNIGTTHITNGCYRYHPVEWSIGEAAGCAAAFALTHEIDLASVPTRWQQFAAYLDNEGIQRHWSPDRARVHVNTFHI